MNITGNAKSFFKISYKITFVLTFMPKEIVAYY